MDAKEEWQRYDQERVKKLYHKLNAIKPSTSPSIRKLLADIEDRKSKKTGYLKRIAI